MPDSKIIERTEYQVKVKTSSGYQFVPNSMQSDVMMAVNIYARQREDLLNRTKRAKVTIEKHIIKTKISDYTETADKIIKDNT